MWSYRHLTSNQSDSCPAQVINKLCHLNKLCNAHLRWGLRTLQVGTEGEYGRRGGYRGLSVLLLWGVILTPQLEDVSALHVVKRMIPWMYWYEHTDKQYDLCVQILREGNNKQQHLYSLLLLSLAVLTMRDLASPWYWSRTPPSSGGVTVTGL